MHILIADSGSSKTQWALIDSSGHTLRSVFTQGINPFYQTRDDIFSILETELFPAVNDLFVDKIFFYGAGCSQPDKIETVHATLREAFPQSDIVVEHDLLAAARALCQNKAGIACILGTGSNSCLYDGSAVIDNIPSLGFLLGDEASGAYFGKKLLQAYFYRELPLNLSQKLKEQYQITRETVLHQIYEQPHPNRYAASFMPFITENRHEAFFRQLLMRGFDEFIERFIFKYEGFRQLPIHFIGSVAWHNADLLSETLTAHQLHIGKIAKSPMEGLISFHKTT